MLKRGNNHTFFIADCRLPIVNCRLLQQLEIDIRKLAISLGGIAEDQPIKVGVVAQRVQVVIVLSANAQVGLKVERLLE